VVRLPVGLKALEVMIKKFLETSLFIENEYVMFGRDGLKSKCPSRIN